MSIRLEGEPQDCRGLTLHRFLAYFGALNVVLIILFSPITQEAIDQSVEQRKLDLGTGSIPTVSAYRLDNPPGQISCMSSFHLRLPLDF